ncbi:hypothetical protein CAPTEDRAFT_222292 [Capitella teleta]|uniref:Methenyltetrahydrofolate synthase domain-containing protein n=1 Tax=Capitella teleta TaxID=283909 RepID=R7U1Y4_CAPTE|nr:hypothetical protein CAPTEDRAFT_222292 [Capitella teleta]|eukprot:ELT97190.1 hypothetical protein CAPTEDRAFT_222292 [Capitella teleta]
MEGHSAVIVSPLGCVPNDSKESIRQRVWEYLEKENIAESPRPVYGRIPNFKGAFEASDRLANTPFFRKANIVKVNPDSPQQQARFRVLESNKTLLVPTPRLQTGLFNKIIPPRGGGKESLHTCATSKGVRDFSVPIELKTRLHVDLVVFGSVATSPKGFRIGKGEGYADMEYAMMVANGAADERTLVVTTVHDCQLMDLPEHLFAPNDVPVDYIVTPTRIIQCLPRSKPSGILWNMLSYEKYTSIPILKAMRVIDHEAGKDVRLADGSPIEEKEEEPVSLQSTRKDPALIIGNIPRGTRTATVKAEIRQLGVTMMKGFTLGRRSFICLFRTEQDLEDAMDRMDKMEINGYPLKVERASQRKEKKVEGTRRWREQRRPLCPTCSLLATCQDSPTEEAEEAMQKLERFVYRFRMTRVSWAHEKKTVEEKRKHLEEGRNSRRQRETSVGEGNSPHAEAGEEKSPKKQRRRKSSKGQKAKAEKSHDEDGETVPKKTPSRRRSKNAPHEEKTVGEDDDERESPPKPASVPLHAIRIRDIPEGMRVRPLKDLIRKLLNVEHFYRFRWMYFRKSAVAVMPPGVIIREDICLDGITFEGQELKMSLDDWNVRPFAIKIYEKKQQQYKERRQAKEDRAAGEVPIVQEDVVAPRADDVPAEESVTPKEEPVNQRKDASQDIVTPVKEVVNPSKEVTPKKEGSTPREESIKAVSPSKESTTPSNEAVKPVSPAKDPVTPAKEVNSPKMAAPKQEVVTSPKEVALKQAVVTPSKEVVTPVKEPVTPNNEAANIASPIKDAVSPTSAASNPVRVSASEKSETETPEKAKDVPKVPITSASPVAGVFPSPVRASSPDADLSSHEGKVSSKEASPLPQVEKITPSAASSPTEVHSKVEETTKPSPNGVIDDGTSV